MTIDNNIPIPIRATRFAALDVLAIGESTTFPIDSLASLCASIQYRQRRHGKRFTRRVASDTVRVWRTA
jgi:hypothetical protein